jgi:hypothetical protein
LAQPVPQYIKIGLLNVGYNMYGNIIRNKVTTLDTTVTGEEQKWNQTDFLLLCTFLCKVHYRKTENSILKISWPV